MSISMRSLMVLISASIILSSASCSRNPGYYLDNGNKLAAQGKLDEAAINFRKAIQRDPNYGEAWYRLGVTLVSQRSGTEAYKALSRALELLPNRDDIKATTADFMLRAYLAQPGGANAPALYARLVAFSDQLLEKNPSSFDGLRLKGYLAAADKRPADAGEFFRRASLVKPLQPDVIFAWTVELFRDNQPQQARGLAFQLIDKDKTYGPIYDVLYQYYVSIGKPDEAEKILQLRLANNPADVQSAIAMARSYAAASKEVEMKTVLQRMLDNPKIFPDARLQVGDFYGALRRWDDALQQYQAGAAADPKKRITYLKRTADLWLAQGKGEQASQTTAEILKENPNDDAAKGVNASLLLATHRPANIAKAVAVYQTLADTHPDNPIWNFNLALAMEANGNLEGARTQLQNAVRKRPDLVQAQAALAELSQATGDYQSALLYSNQVLRLSPNLPKVRLLRAVSLMNTGNEKDAGKEFASLERAFPRDVAVQLDVQLGLGALDLHDQKFDQAEERFRKLVRENPQDIRALTGLAQTLQSENRGDNAISLLQDALQKSPDSLGVRMLLARTAGRAGKYDLAIEQYQRLLAVTPDSVQANRELGELWQWKGDSTNALSCFRRASELAPNDAAPRALLGGALASQGRNAEALASYRRALELKPGNADFSNAIAYLLAETGGDLNEALKLAQQALRVDANQANYIDTLGWVYFRKNQNEAAMQVFRNLTSEHPEQATFHYHLAMALLRHGDKAAARNELNDALTRKPAAHVRRDIEAALAARS